MEYPPLQIASNQASYDPFELTVEEEEIEPQFQ